jgi:transcription antitermination factor NusG
MCNSSFDLHEGDRWFVAQTLHRRENLAALHLGAQGFRSFFPRFSKTVRHARQLREVVEPVFPGYIFVIISTERDRWRSINGTFGVSRLVSENNGPLAVPAGVVEALIATVGKSGLVRLGGELERGQPIRVLTGPFAQQLGVLDSLDGKSRVRVLLSLMGTQVQVTMARSSLTAA